MTIDTKHGRELKRTAEASGLGSAKATYRDWLEDNAEALLSAAERVEVVEAPRTSDDPATAWAQKVDALRETAKLAKEEMNREATKRVAAERRVAELEAERREAVKRGNWFEAECGRQKVERIAAERARDEALRRAEAAERVVRLGKAWMEQGPCEEDDRYTAFVDALKAATLDPKVKP